MFGALRLWGPLDKITQTREIGPGGWVQRVKRSKDPGLEHLNPQVDGMSKRD